MSAQNEMRRVKKTNLEHTAKRLRYEIENLTRTLCINLDCSITRPDDLSMDVIDSQMDELKVKWAELLQTTAELARIEEALR
ncbi:MAG TPA: hypothetical protein VF795_00800 [Desulfuromonadaceae bacterium]